MRRSEAFGWRVPKAVSKPNTTDLHPVSGASEPRQVRVSQTVVPVDDPPPEMAGSSHSDDKTTDAAVRDSACGMVPRRRTEPAAYRPP